MLFDPKDMPVALGRRCCGSWSRHGPLAWRNDETGARVSGENGVENSAPIDFGARIGPWRSFKEFRDR
jgi:hypothetical protein